MRILFFILTISINWAIGFQALNLPITSESLALSNAGIAYPLNTSINPSYKQNDSDIISFSSNYWFEGISGKTILNQFDRTCIVQTWMYHSDLIGGFVAKSLGFKNTVYFSSLRMFFLIDLLKKSEKRSSF